MYVPFIHFLIAAYVTALVVYSRRVVKDHEPRKLVIYIIMVVEFRFYFLRKFFHLSLSLSCNWKHWKKLPSNTVNS